MNLIQSIMFTAVFLHSFVVVDISNSHITFGGKNCVVIFQFVFVYFALLFLFLSEYSVNYDELRLIWNGARIMYVKRLFESVRCSVVWNSSTLHFTQWKSDNWFQMNDVVRFARQLTTQLRRRCSSFISKSSVYFNKMIINWQSGSVAGKEIGHVVFKIPVVWRCNNRYCAMNSHKNSPEYLLRSTTLSWYW